MRKIILASVAAFAFIVMAVPADAAPAGTKLICHFDNHTLDYVIGDGSKATGQQRKDCKGHDHGTGEIQRDDCPALLAKHAIAGECA